MKRKDKELLSWLSFGAFLIIVGSIFLIVPDLISHIKDFVGSFELEQIREYFYFPVPAGTHPVFYQSLAMFCFAYGVYQIFLLMLKFGLHMRPTKKVETFTSLIFWLITGFVFWMLKDGVIGWLTFVAVLIILAAISLIIRSVGRIVFRGNSQ